MAPWRRCAKKVARRGRRKGGAAEREKNLLIGAGKKMFRGVKQKHGKGKKKKNTEVGLGETTKGGVGGGDTGKLSFKCLEFL